MSIYRRYVVGESWETDDAGSNRRATTSLRKVLLSAREVENALRQGQTPVDSSIEKWTRIHTLLVDSAEIRTIGALETFIGAKTCGLCIDALKRYRKAHGKPKSSRDKCSMCQLAKKQPCPDSDSVYSQIEEIVQNAKNAPQLYRDDPEVFERIQILILKLLKILKAL